MSIFTNPNYLNVTYNNKPSIYPKLLANYLFGKYPRSFKILDLGCGNGDITNELINMGFDVYAIDATYNPHPNNNISKEKYKVHNLNESFLRFPFVVDKKNVLIPDKDIGNFDNRDLYPLKFDIVFSKSVIEHVKNPDIFIASIYKLLNFNGKIITMTPSWKHSYKEQFYIDHTHKTPFTKHSLKTIHEIHGFSNVKCSYFYQLPIVWNNPTLMPLVKLVGALGLPYQPFNDISWPETINKFIRFSTEAMLYCEADKIIK